MQLVDAIFLVGQMSDRSVVCAREPFVWGSEAVITEFTEEFVIPPHVTAQGFAYFLGQEEINELLGAIGRKHASRKTRAEFVCHYATHDAYPQWFLDLADE